MRPVERGADPGGYLEYGQAYPKLVGRIGRYCSFCEARLKNGAVEHALPKDAYPQYALSWDWPHLPPEPAPFLTPTENALAGVLLERTGVDRSPLHPRWSEKDDRWELRNEAWDKAFEARADLADEDTPIHRKRIVQLAAATGFWSVWTTVFQDDLPMLRSLNEAFKGTASVCFDRVTLRPIRGARGCP